MKEGKGVAVETRIGVELKNCQAASETRRLRELGEDCGDEAKTSAPDGQGLSHPLRPRLCQEILAKMKDESKESEA